MSAFPGGEAPLIPETHRHEHPQVELFAHIEGLCCEETELVEVAEHERSAEQQRRLHEITAELDRVFAHLRERAHRLGHGDG